MSKASKHPSNTREELRLLRELERFVEIPPNLEPNHPVRRITAELSALRLKKQAAKLASIQR